LKSLGSIRAALAVSKRFIRIGRMPAHRLPAMPAFPGVIDTGIVTTTQLTVFYRFFR
jgi:hypothetical protein